MEKRIPVEDQIRRNKLLTVIICTFMALLFIAVVFAFGYIFFGNIYIALLFGLPIALAYIAITYSFSVQTVLSAAKARPADPRIREEKLLADQPPEGEEKSVCRLSPGSIRPGLLSSGSAP